MTDWKELQWLNPPASSQEEQGALIVSAAPGTDFWQQTFYGFERDSGHFLHRSVHGEFTATLEFHADYRILYDQAGLMVRASPTHWVKCGIELTDGVPHLSVVFTNGMSDWSASPTHVDGPVSLRVTRLRGALIIQSDASPSAGAWQMLRLIPWTASDVLSVGPMVCAPERTDDSFSAKFHRFEVTSPAIDALH